MKQITVVSTFSEDRLYYGKNDKRVSIQGGPAFYISDAFVKENISFEMRLAQRIIVDIFISNDGEFGKISETLDVFYPDYQSIQTPYILLSAIINEISLNTLERYQGKIFLDAQGFVRDGADFGKKKMWNPSDSIKERIFCLKVTLEEAGYLPEQFLEKQKDKMLIITKGSAGADLYFFGQKYSRIPNVQVNAHNTIGAGDSFFSYFIAQFIRVGDAMKSLDFAIIKTTDFLLSKQETLD